MAWKSFTGPETKRVPHTTQFRALEGAGYSEVWILIRVIADVDGSMTVLVVNTMFPGRTIRPQ